MAERYAPRRSVLLGGLSALALPRLAAAQERTLLNVSYDPSR